MEGGAPKGRRLDGESGMKKSGKARLKSTICGSTRSTADAVPLPQWGRQRYESNAIPEITPFPRGEGKEEAASPPQNEANPASLRSAAPSKGRGSRGYSLLPVEEGAPKGRRLDGESGMKKSGKDLLKCAVCKSTLSTAGAVPLPQWGRLRNGDAAFLDTTPFPRGEGKEEAASPQKRKPTPPRCARQPFP